MTMVIEQSAPTSSEVTNSVNTELSPIWSDWLNEADLQKLTNHPLLQAFSKGEASVSTLKTLLIQHHHYSRHFTRYLCALISNLSNIDDVRSLTENLLEEMGLEGGIQITHAELYQRTLRTVGAKSESLSTFPETQTLVETMMGYCRSENPLEGLAAMCLGAEAIVPLIYRPIFNALTEFGYGEDATEFFSFHIEEDEEHALTMLAIMKRLTLDNPAALKMALDIGKDMIQKRVEMLDGIWLSTQQQTSQLQDVSDEAPADTKRFSSADFWQVPARLQAQIPDRLCHQDVTLKQSSGAEQFTSERSHKVHIVDLPTNTISMTIGHLQPSESTRMHRHNYETVIYVMAGEGFSRIGSRTVKWTAGDAIYVPIWAEHQHVSTSNEECVYVACENAPLLQNLGGIALREELSAVNA